MFGALKVTCKPGRLLYLKHYYVTVLPCIPIPLYNPSSGVRDRQVEITGTIKIMTNARIHVSPRVLENATLFFVELGSERNRKQKILDATMSDALEECNMMHALVCVHLSEGMIRHSLSSGYCYQNPASTSFCSWFQIIWAGWLLGCRSMTK